MAEAEGEATSFKRPCGKCAHGSDAIAVDMFPSVNNLDRSFTRRPRNEFQNSGILIGICHAAGGELEQIQFLLGHVSVETTERYLGCKQRLRQAVNDKIGLEQ